ncbi:hypothetical protein ExPUPEC79_01413 [Escherichia coli]|nr:hypothetical protein HmCmsJML288_01161 [Escherichia coli]GDU82985.1 hypothetical protein ExPUPEC79_01413 [Escherichia coli]
MRVDGHIYFNAINRDAITWDKKIGSDNQAARISHSALLDYLFKTKLFIRQNGRSIRRKDSGRGNFKIGEYTVGDGFWLPCCRKHQAHGLTLIDS